MEPIFDSDLQAIRRRRARSIADEGALYLARRAEEELEDRLASVSRRFDDAVTLFAGRPQPAAIVEASGKAAKVSRIEDERIFSANDADRLARPDPLPLAPASVDLAVSLNLLDAVDDLPGALIQIRRSLRPDGLFLGCMAGAGTLAELRESLLAAESALSGGAAPRVHPFADVRDVGALLQRAGFALPVVDLDTVTVRYRSLASLVADLRAMGATSILQARSRKPAPRELFALTEAIYAERFSDADGKLRATFTTIWMSGWAPADNQPQPARRGSATVSLADALKT